MERQSLHWYGPSLFYLHVFYFEDSVYQTNGHPVTPGDWKLGWTS